MKKMKKRRELDALVNGKHGRKKPTNGQHELLRGESESSEVEEFSIPEQTVIRKRHAGSSRFCLVCFMVCCMFLLLACMMAIIGLVWVHVELRRNVDQLQTTIRRLESGSQSNPEEFQELHTKIQKMETTISELQSGDNGISSVESKVTTALKQISVLNLTTESLTKNVASASQLVNLPENVKSLSKETADIGANLQSIKEDVNTLLVLKSTLSPKVEELTDIVNSLKNSTGSSHETGDFENLNILNKEVNTLSGKLLHLESQSENSVTDLQNKVTENSKIAITLQTKLNEIVKDISAIEIQLNRSKEAGERLITKTVEIATDQEETLSTDIPVAESSPINLEVTTGSPEEITPSYVEQSQSETTTNSINTANHISIPRIKTQAELYTNFLRWDKNGDGYVKYKDLPDFLGPDIPDEVELKKYDVNSDGKYSVDEIMSAFGYSHFERTTPSIEDSNTPLPIPTASIKKYPFQETPMNDSNDST